MNRNHVIKDKSPSEYTMVFSFHSHAHRLYHSPWLYPGNESAAMKETLIVDAVYALLGGITGLRNGHLIFRALMDSGNFLQ